MDVPELGEGTPKALNNQESCGGRKSGAFQKKGEGGNSIPGQGESISEVQQEGVMSLDGEDEVTRHVV